MRTDAPPRFIGLSAQDGEAIWTVGFLAVRKLAAEDTDGQLEVAEFIFPAGYSPPWHVHHKTAECFYVLSGVIRFQCGDVVERHGPGGFVHLPAGVPHSFYVESEDGARVLHTGSPGGLWDFHAAAGRPAPALTLPPSEPMDIERLNALAAEHALDILGPPLSA
jgi:quercetin dioxygenase-like cupin family protein